MDKAQCTDKGLPVVSEGVTEIFCRDHALAKIEKKRIGEHYHSKIINDALEQMKRENPSMYMILEEIFTDRFLSEEARETARSASAIVYSLLERQSESNFFEYTIGKDLGAKLSSH